MGKMVDLKRPKESKKDLKLAGSTSQDDYSYGTRINLGDHELTKLGMDKMPRVGDTIQFRAHGKIVSASHNQHEGGKPSRDISIQIQKMRLHDGDAETAIDAMDKGIEEAGE